MGRMGRNIIVVVDEGLHERTPMVFTHEHYAGEWFEKLVTKQGFRKKSLDESWEAYQCAFWEWEDSPECTYDKADWEIHWWRDVPVNLDPTFGDELDDHVPVHSTRQDFGEPWQDPQPDKEF